MEDTFLKWLFSNSWLREPPIPVHQWIHPWSLHLPRSSHFQLPCQERNWSSHWPDHGIQAEEGCSLCLRCSLHLGTGLLVSIFSAITKLPFQTALHSEDRNFKEYIIFSASMRSATLSTSPSRSVTSTPAGSSAVAHSELERSTWRTSSTTSPTLDLWDKSWL